MTRAMSSVSGAKAVPEAPPSSSGTAGPPSPQARSSSPSPSPSPSPSLTAPAESASISAAGPPSHLPAQSQRLASASASASASALTTPPRHAMQRRSLPPSSLSAATTAAAAIAMTMTAPPSAISLPATLPPPQYRMGAATGMHLVRGGRHSSKFGTVNYSVDEMVRLTDKVRTVLPVTSDEWLHVAYQFNYRRPESIPYREVDSLKRKFKKMYCSRAPRGGGALPVYIEQAKELRRLISQRSERVQQQQQQQNDTSVWDTPTNGGLHVEAATLGATPTVPVVSAATESDAAPVTGDTSVISNQGMEATVVPGSHEHGEQQASDALNDAQPGDATVGGEDPREIAARLRQMEEEFHRSTSAARLRTAADPVDTTPTASPSGPSSLRNIGANSQAMASTPDAAVSGDAAPQGTVGIINLLRYSIERKKRTLEEQMLSESERVRKERKKRKMEQALYNIHREHETTSTGDSISRTNDGDGQLPVATPQSPRLSLPAGVTGGGGASLGIGDGGSSLLSSVSSVSSSAASSLDPSLGVMELMLHYMVAQQQELALRDQVEAERRRQEKLEKARRRRVKDAHRRRDKRELMLVMEALLQSNFPSELRHYIETTTTTEDDTMDDVDDTESGAVQGSKKAHSPTSGPVPQNADSSPAVHSASISKTIENSGPATLIGSEGTPNSGDVATGMVQIPPSV